MIRLSDKIFGVMGVNNIDVGWKSKLTLFYLHCVYLLKFVNCNLVQYVHIHTLSLDLFSAV